MVLKEFQSNMPCFQFAILGTDISTMVLEEALHGIYSDSNTDSIPLAFKRKYLVKPTNTESDMVRITPELRALVRFRRLNFMDDDFGFREPFDIIFCRNVMIYFDRPTQERLLTKLVDNLLVGRYLFLGHSETLLGLNRPLGLKQVTQSVYQRV
jgi:chemotaxis protein methyltransferase CheR